MQIYLITALLFSLLVAVFAVQNTEIVTIRFITWQFSVSLVLVILGSAIVGALALYFLGLFKQVGAWFKIRQLDGKKKDLEKQLEKLETMIKGAEESPNDEVLADEGEKTPVETRVGEAEEPAEEKRVGE